jgi:hypothetical protein
MKTLKTTPIRKHVPPREFAKSKKCGCSPLLPVVAVLRMPLEDSSGTYQQLLTGQQ